MTGELDETPTGARPGAFAGLVGLAARFDEALDQRRGAVLVGGAILTNVCLFASPRLYAWVLPTYAFLLWAVLAARLWGQRDEDGRWSASVAARNAARVLVEIAEGVGLLAHGAWTAALRTAGRWLVGAGLVVVTAAYPAALGARAAQTLVGGADREGALDSLAAAAWVVAAVGAVLWLVGAGVQWRSRARFQAGAPVTGTNLPLLTDLRREPVPASAPKLRPLLDALASWKTRCSRGRGHKEADFERSLVRHLQREIPDAEVRGAGRVIAP